MLPWRTLDAVVLVDADVFVVGCRVVAVIDCVAILASVLICSLATVFGFVVVVIDAVAVTSLLKAASCVMLTPSPSRTHCVTLSRCSLVH